jgi:hypothetical protein
MDPCQQKPLDRPYLMDEVSGETAPGPVPPLFHRPVDSHQDLDLHCAVSGPSPAKT